MVVPKNTQTRFVGITYHTHTHIILLYGAHAGMENQYRIPMDQYQKIVILYILNQKCI